MSKTKKALLTVSILASLLGVYTLIPRTKDVYLIGPVNFTMTRNLIKDLQPTWVDYINDIDVLNVHINSPGGYASEGLGIVDILNAVDIPTKNYIAEGFACSAGALILATGPKGHRLATKNCMIMIHYAYSVNPVTGEKLPEDAAGRLLNKMIRDIFINATGNDYNTIHNGLSFDNFMTPEQAVEFGLIDEVLKP